MHLATYVDALQRDLSAVAAGTDDKTTQTAGRLAAALEPALRLRFLEALGEATREVTALVPGLRVEVRLAGTDPVFAVTEESGTTATDDGGDLSARISLRLPPALKARIETAAMKESLSVNSWVVAALSEAASERQRRIGKRLTGFARS